MMTDSLADVPEERPDSFWNFYKDHGCQHSKKCVTCPLPQCMHDGPAAWVRARNIQNTKDDDVRANAVVLASKRMERHLAIKQVAKEYGVTDRTILRVMARTGL